VDKLTFKGEMGEKVGENEGIFSCLCDHKTPVVEYANLLVQCIHDTKAMSKLPEVKEHFGT